MTGAAVIVQGDALHLPLPDESVDLIVTSPPYAFLRAYNAGPNEIGQEDTPQAYLEALWAATAEMVRVLKPTGSIMVNLGDKYASDNRGSGYDPKRGDAKFWPPGPRSLSTGHGTPAKSLMLLPERYRIGCVDQLGLIARAVIVWDKPNGLPESVTDRVRRSHEDWVHLTRGPRYYSATDEIREPHAPASLKRYEQPFSPDSTNNGQHRLQGSPDYTGTITANPLGKLPGSVWSIPSEPLNLPGYFTMRDGRLLDFLAPERGSQRPRTNGHHPGLFDLDPYAEAMASGDGGAWRWMRATGVTSSPWPQSDTGLQLRTAASHYAAFPTRWPEQLIKGFSPPGICLDCGQGRVPVVEREQEPLGKTRSAEAKARRAEVWPTQQHPGAEWTSRNDEITRVSATILGYACGCTPHTLHPERRQPSMTPRTSGSLQVEVPATGRQHAWPERQPTREWHLDGWTPPPTRPAVILDPFSGVGTTVGVAKRLGRIGIGVDLSAPYSRAAKWRVNDPDQFGKAEGRSWLARQGSLL